MVLILTTLFLSALITDIGAISGCCSHHGGVCSYQCPNGGIGHRCCDGTPLSEKCAPYYSQCNDYTPSTPIPTPKPTPTSTPTPVTTPSQTPILYGNTAINGKTLRIGAFNIQVFGTTKASKPEVMEVLGKIIRTYDIVAIQEIRDKSQTALPALADTVNSGSSQYDYVVSERLGRTTSKEQYAYIYNTQAVELAGTPQIYPEPIGTDPFHREPFIASFKALNGDLDATLITIHIDPDEATEEINSLDAVVKYAQSVYPDEDDFIVMGDLNADCSYFDEDSTSTLSSSDYYWCIDDNMDTTTKTTDCTYDRIIITNAAVSDFTGDSGVFRYDIEYGLTVDETTVVSDHYPVYAEFWCKGDMDSTTKPTTTPASTHTPAPRLTPTPELAPKEKDSDDDGIPDKYDYAPNDPKVQTKEDVMRKETPTATLTPTSTVPGFEVVFAIGSLLAVAYLALRRRG